MKKSINVWALAMSATLTVTAYAAEQAPSASSGQAEEALVLHYTCDDGAGHSFLLDKSGNGNDGKIVGNVEWVEEKNRSVLRFDGKTYVDAGTSANAMMAERGTLETWCLPEEIGGGLIAWATPHIPGSDYWPDQRIVLSFWTYHDSRLLGVLGNGVDNTRCALLHPVEKGKWAHLALTFNGTNLHLFVNGELVQTLPQDDIVPNLKDASLRIGQSNGLGGYNLLGQMAEVRIYNRALSAEEIGRHFTEGVKQLGVKMPSFFRVTTRLAAKQGELTALCDLARISNLPARPGVYVALLASAELALGEASLKAGPPAKPGRNANKKVLQEKTAPVPPNTGVVPVTFVTGSLSTGLYEVSAIVKDLEANKDVDEMKTVQWYLPEVGQLVSVPPAGSPSVAGAAAKEGRKILNNLVTQLAAVDNLEIKDYREVPFVNPRKGWVFVSATALPANPRSIIIGLDTEKREAAMPLTTNKPTMETMRLLSAGEHKLCIWSDSASGEKQAVLTRLVVRAVPAMMYCGWPGCSYVAGYGDYDFKFLSRDILPNINTFVGSPGLPRVDLDRDDWKKRGGQSLQELAIPTLIREVLKDVPYPLTGDYVYNYWTNSPGFTKSNMDGAVNDEFGGGEDVDFRGYIEGVKRVAANPAFKDKALYMWSGPPMALSLLSRNFVQAVIDSGYKLAWEEYLVEDPTVEEARKTFNATFRHGVALWEQAFPGFPRHAILVLFISSAPPQTANINPGVDYKVFLDMQFQYLATAPEFFGLWGVMIYKATYAEEEVLRWAGRLFRHYCIEGNTNLLSEQYGFTYNLRHIRNPDFDEGLTGWQVSAAEPGSVKTGHMRGLHRLLCRYHGAREGNNFLIMKRSGKKPNRVSQDITGLQTGRFYSMKMYAADHQDFVQAKSEKKRLAVSVNIENAEMIPAKTVVSDIKGYDPAAQYRGKEPPYMNYHRYVFRAKGPTARLTISDWASESAPGAPAGLPTVAGAAAQAHSTSSGQVQPGGPVSQETLINFIETQPYLED